MRHYMWLTIGGLILTATVTYAQPGQGPGRGGRGGPGFGGGFGFGRGMMTSKLDLMNAEAVQRELGLQDEQINKIRELAQQVREERRAAFQNLGGPADFQNLSPEERQQRFAQMQSRLQETNRKINEKFLPMLSEILTEQQEQRLQQIAWQVAGTQALLDPEVQRELKLSQEQIDKLNKINKETEDKLAEMRPQFGRGPGRGENTGGPPNFQETFARIREITENRDKSFQEVLTAEQKSRWEQMRGKEFDVAQLRPQFGRGFGGPGGAGGPGDGPGQGRRGGPGGGRPEGAPNDAGRPRRPQNSPQ